MPLLGASKLLKRPLNADGCYEKGERKMNEELMTIMKRLRELYETEEKQVSIVVDCLYWEFDCASKYPQPSFNK